MNPTREQHLHYTIQQSNAPESVATTNNDKKRTFRKIIIYGCKTAAANSPLVDNDADVYLARIADGPKIFTDLIAGNGGTPGGGGPALSYTVPDSLQEMRLEDIWVYGTAGDGVYVSYVTSHPI